MHYTTKHKFMDKKLTQKKNKQRCKTIIFNSPLGILNKQYYNIIILVIAQQL